MPQPIAYDSQRLDLSKRAQETTTVVASPAGSAETIIATLVVAGFADTALINGVDLSGWCAYTVGTSGVSMRLRIRETNIAGTVVGDTGILTGSQHGAGILSADDVEGFDAALVGTYVLTMTVGSAAAASTVSAVKLRALIV